MVVTIVVGALVALAAWELLVQHQHKPWEYEGQCPGCGRNGWKAGCRSIRGDDAASRARRGLR